MSEKSAEKIGKGIYEAFKKDADMKNFISGMFSSAIEKAVINSEINISLNLGGEQSDQSNGVEEDNTAIKQKYEAEVISLKQKHAEEISALNQKCETENSTLKQKYEDENSDLKQECETKISSLKQDYETEISSLKQKHNDEIAVLMKEHENKIFSLNNKISEFRETSESAVFAKKKAETDAEECRKKYEDFEKLCNKYYSLSDNCKKMLMSMFPVSSPVAIIAPAFNENNIKNLWDFIKNMLMQNEYNVNSDISDLQELWKLMVNIHNKIKNKPKFSLIIPEINSRYDSYTQIPLHNKTDGYISRVIMVGYKRVNNGDIERKAIVLL